MCHPNSVSRLVLFSLSIASVGVLNAASAGFLVPSYFAPGTGGAGGSGDGWAALSAAASQTQITAILNPNSGPAAGPADPNYVSAMTNLENAGGKVIAYVDTANGNASLATVEAQINTYVGQYGNLIGGFFLDDMFVLPGTLAYYQSLNSFIKGLKPSYLVAGNPGQPFLNGVTPADYLSTADVFDIFEGPNTGPPAGIGFNNYPYGLNWFQSYASTRFENIVFDVPTSAAMLADLSRAMQLNAGYVYITDQAGANPYSQLPSYWNQEVSALAAAPEPGTMIMLALGGIIAFAALVRRQH
jgi:hypothetical protein